jgi:sec-independent protein translocase protein TatC
MSKNENDQAMPLATHLLELRTRILRSLGVTLVIFLALFSFANELYTFIAQPLLAELPDNASMISTEVTGPFLAPFKMALVISAFLAMPYILFEIWGFVAPGLFKSEKKLVAPLLVSSVILFYTGVAFAYYVIFPLMFHFFSMATPEGVTYSPDISSFFSIVSAMFFAFGVIFEIPIATLILIRAGITTVESLSEKRPYIIVGCFVVGMLLTPPDVISQTLMALPMWMLFEIGIFIGRFIQPKSSD